MILCIPVRVHRSTKAGFKQLFFAVSKVRAPTVSHCFPLRVKRTNGIVRKVIDMITPARSRLFQTVSVYSQTSQTLFQQTSQNKH